MSQRNITRRATAGGLAAGVGLLPYGIGVSNAQPARQTFLLVHGTFAGGWCWRRVADLLEKQGHKVFSPTLTGLGERSHLASKDINLDTHVTDIVNVFKWEDLRSVCLVAHSYGGWIGSGVAEQVGDRITSIVWLDAYKPGNGQKPIDLTNEAFRKIVLTAVEKGDATFSPPPKLPPIFVNENDRAYVDAKLTPHPVSTYLQPIKLTGARENVTKKTYIRALNFASPAFDRALLECRTDQTWNTVETNSYHIVMLDEPEWLAETLVKSA
jgi:pimeloyl-ACP methyl ester carboxylesterase